ncbi:MAG: type 1 glutamine amidotransferase domain-containing protein [Pseudomarimonas sp.]
MRVFLKRALLGLLIATFALVAGGWLYVETLNLDAEPVVNTKATAASLGFVPAQATNHGRILAVVTSSAELGPNNKRTGFELTELARAWWVFVASGYSVDIASPRGGSPPMVKDDDLVDADFAFLNDAGAQATLSQTIPLADVDPSLYDAAFFVGGKGAMLDFRGNPHIARIVRSIWPRGVIGAVCHGPAALLDITSENGRPLLAGRRIAAFSNAEELFLIPHAQELFGFLLQDALSSQAAEVVEGPMYLDNTVIDGRLITGQNPWSTWATAEAMVRALGATPPARVITAEERSVQLLQRYVDAGLDVALADKASGARSDKRLLLMHAMVAAMRGEMMRAFDLQRLARA